MLRSIRIKKFLYIENVDLELSESLNVFTGETGVGKSLIVDAIQFAFGEKGRSSEGDYVELEFEKINNRYSEENRLIIAREIKKGRSLYYINGRKATLSAVKEATEGILSVHGQNQQQILFNRDRHIHILDSYCRIQPLVDEYKKIYKQLKELEKQEEEIVSRQSERLRELDILKYQLDELKSAEIKKGEKETLEERHNYLSQIEDIKTAVFASLGELSEEEDSVLSKLSYVIKNLEKVSDFSRQIKDALSSLEEAKNLIDDACYSLGKIDLEFDQQELTQIEERLNLINRLELKYGTDEKGLIDLADQFEKRIQELENLEFQLPQIKKKKEELYRKTVELAEEISKKRKEGAERLEKEVEQHIKELAMPEGRFVVKIEETPLSINGKDRVVFLFSANKGFEPMPIDSVASGGEVSRLSLALKLVAGSDVDCMVFDEIDTGIGGKTANALAEKLKKLSEKYQVILITHLPQIAAAADTHFYVEKLFTDSTTKAQIKLLNPEERVKELSRMLSGKTDKNTLKLAEEMIKSLSSV
ncbi:DNA repair protein RecN [Persephonella sp.]